MENNIRNIGIFAHVDAGKTTLTEQLLLKTGAIRTAGRVDEGTAHTDTLPLERARGISIRSKAVCIRHRGVDIRIIDTPGHIDFAAEVENALLAIDGAVIVLSAVEGVQPQTLAILREALALRLPLLLFINKTDRAGADAEAVLARLAQMSLRPVWALHDRTALLDMLTLDDDILLQAALEEEVTDATLWQALARACCRGSVLPAFSGSALRGEGIAELLDAIVDLLPPPPSAAERAIVAYHVAHTKDERQINLRIYGGELSLGDMIGAEKIKRLRLLTQDGYLAVRTLSSGDIGQIVGPQKLRSGEWLGIRQKGRPALSVAILRAQVVPEDEAKLPLLQMALQRMSDEQLSLAPHYEPRTRQMWLQLTGDMQKEIVEQTLRDEFGIAVRLLPPTVIYRETPAGHGSGELEMFFSPWYARASFSVAPGPYDSGVVFRSEVSTDYLFLKYQRDIEETVYEALQEGLYGWQVTDIEVTLSAGECTSITRPGSRFGPVVPLGLFAALKDAGTILQEPLLEFEAEFAREQCGKVLYDISQMRGVCEPPLYQGERCQLKGRIPAATSLGYAQTIRELSRGLGYWHTRFCGYQACPPEVTISLPRTTPDPCQPELYMMHINGVVRS